MSSDFFGGIPGSGSLNRGNHDGPPNLADYPDGPQYDLTTVVQLLGVRPMTLWSWLKQLGMAASEHTGEAAARRYSERDLVACLWLRDQLLRGVTVAQAADVLLRAQATSSAPPSPELDVAQDDVTAPEGEPREQPGNAGQPIVAEGYVPAYDRASSAHYRSLPQWPAVQESPQSPAVAQPPLWSGALPPGISSPMRPIPTPSRPPVYSGPLRSANPSGPLRSPSTTGPMRPPVYTVPLNPGMGMGPPSNPGVYAGPSSGPLRAGPSGGLGTPSGSRWPIPTAPSGREMRGMVPQLVRAFASFDTYTANRLVDEAVSSRNFEITCLGLLLPALSRVADLSAHRQMTNPEHHFAINYVRGRLYSVFATTKERLDAPVVVVACAPREMDDIGALALATFWRRVGLRIIFLGQDADESDLVRETYARRPQLICVCINSSQRIRALARIARGIMHLDGHATVFTYSGAPFARNPELQRRVTGVYLGDDPATATWHALRLLGVDVRNGPPAAPAGIPGAEFAG